MLLSHERWMSEMYDIFLETDFIDGLTGKHSAISVTISQVKAYKQGTLGTTTMWQDRILQFG